MMDFLADDKVFCQNSKNLTVEQHEIVTARCRIFLYSQGLGERTIGKTEQGDMSLREKIKANAEALSHTDPLVAQEAQLVVAKAKAKLAGEQPKATTPEYPLYRNYDRTYLVSIAFNPIAALFIHRSLTAMNLKTKFWHQMVFFSLIELVGDSKLVCSNNEDDNQPNSLPNPSRKRIRIPSFEKNLQSWRDPNSTRLIINELPESFQLALSTSCQDCCQLLLQDSHLRLKLRSLEGWTLIVEHICKENIREVKGFYVCRLYRSQVLKIFPRLLLDRIKESDMWNKEDSSLEAISQCVTVTIPHNAIEDIEVTLVVGKNSWIGNVA
ncbi:hypothetical protein EJ04DRAFT_556681 [Polyplosphaeria fusca]|uniref:Uncharacterized protein n=1 Tax=Polyplosphaeria fusca TaxID=682080 RepID=A0A9P4UX36_9PLEO|nr:hypothetical protein EJ04DRAFT_556681 [Polyplosphaeria fusca]